MPKLKTEDDLRQCALDMHHRATQEYEKDLGSPSPASLLETKNLANSIISDVARGTKFMCCDLKDCFPAAPICPTNTYQTTFDKNTNYKKAKVSTSGDNCTILPALNEISQQQSKPTMKILEKCQRLFDHVATHPHISIRFYVSDMVLHIDSDAVCLVSHCWLLLLR